MYLSIQDLTQKELQRLEMKFGARLSAFHNPYYQVCVEEIMCALDNELEEEQLEEFKRNPLFATLVSEMAQYLYEMIDSQIDDVYEKAVSVVRNEIEE